MFTTSDPSSKLDGVIANKPPQHKIILKNWEQVYNQRDLSQFVQIINDETETFKCMNLPGKPTEATTTIATTTTTVSTTTTAEVTTTTTTTTTTITTTTTTTSTSTSTETITTTSEPCANYRLPNNSILYKQFFANSELKRIFECIQVSLQSMAILP